MNITLIAAVAANGVIGNKDALPWHYPKDMQRFVKLTKETSVVIMGRKTREAIGKPLLGRINIILTRDKNYKPVGGGVIYHDIEKALDFARYYGREMMVIGGEQIYKAFLPHANKLCITNINAPYVGDAYFPDVDTLEWKHVTEEAHPADDQHRYPFSFDIYKRVQS